MSFESAGSTYGSHFGRRLDEKFAEVEKRLQALEPEPEITLSISLDPATIEKGETSILRFSSTAFSTKVFGPSIDEIYSVPGKITDGFFVVNEPGQYKIHGFDRNGVFAKFASATLAVKEEPTDTHYPPALKTVHVSHGKVGDVLKMAASASPGTHFILPSGVFDVPHSAPGNIVGNRENPIVIIGNDTTLRPSQWGVGEQGAIWQVYAQNFVIDGVNFDTLHLTDDIAEIDPLRNLDGGDCWEKDSKLYELGRTDAIGFNVLNEMATGAIAGRLLNINSRTSRMLSKNVKIVNCRFSGSYRHACVAQGEEILFQGNGFYDCGMFNRDGTRGIWPFILGSWWYWDGNEKVLCDDVRFVDNIVERSYGECICPIYTHRGTAINNFIIGGRFVGLYVMCCEEFEVRDNVVKADTSTTGRGSDKRQYEFALETYSSFPVVYDMTGKIVGNTARGKNHDRHALRLNPHKTKNATYHGIEMIENSFDGEFRDNRIRMERFPRGPGNCTTDMLWGVNDHIADPAAWRKV